MTVGFFMPLPLAVMIPFMAGQSFAMGEAFGKGFQYGKRRISAMTNEEFNAMDAKDHFVETTADISAMIPSMKSQMNNFSMLQTDIIKTLIEQLKDAGIQISEQVITTAGEVFEQGPPGGTELAQNTLDSLRGYVGMPPIYAKLIEPAAVRMLIKWWEEIGILPSIINAGVVWSEIKKIFGVNPPSVTATTIMKWIVDNIQKTTLVGPPAPPIIQPPDTQPPNTIVVAPDGTLINKDTRAPKVLKDTPKHIFTERAKLQEEYRILQEMLHRMSQTTQGSSGKLRMKNISARMIVIRQKVIALQAEWAF